MPKRVADLSDSELADQWGAAKKREDLVGGRIDELRKEFERRKIDFASGAFWMIFRDVSNQARLSVADIRAKMGEAWCKAFEKTSQRVSYRVKARTPEAE